ncbi:unnamed protein product [Cuscuta epithymum]|uniref:Uncharacterized protein n=1 Tax=Cuscuta epithymum TaxID=186058 RepID=A0AAV0GAG1_9ASTE|nr:unnamed protein product [Cuscuta epithymum]CAH9144563.1 unnamed protein product [Cuscuta epithymum]
MVSAALGGRNELNWTQSGELMGKVPHSRPHLKSNSNSNPKKKQKQSHPVANGSYNDDANLFNQPLKDSNGVSLGNSQTYNIQSYTKSELVELRKRLIAELEQVRNLRERIESGQFSTSTAKPRPPGKSKRLSGNENISNGFNGMTSGLVCGGIGVAEMGKMMKECGHLLSKLMKHKIAWIFKTPVDAAALGLHDYHQIVKNPMDLGTVKSNLSKNIYPTPVEFAADVRLTFNNALLYNPKTDQVHGWADLLLSRFEELFRPIQDKLSKLVPERKVNLGIDELHNSFRNHIPVPEISKKPKAAPIPRVSKQQEILPIQSSASTHSVPPPQIHPPSHVDQPVQEKVAIVKQPKQRAKSTIKREMTMEEKHKLGFGLQNLPEDKMPQLVQIIRMRNGNMAEDGDEIELDIEALDTETLWELDRFVNNCRKVESKTNREAFDNSVPTSNADEAAVVDKSDPVENNPKLVELGEEDIDIGDDMPDASFTPVEIEKEDVVASREPDNHSSSSSSESSSSSGSDSGSSSGSDSDHDDAQS